MLHWYSCNNQNHNRSCFLRLQQLQSTYFSINIFLFYRNISNYTITGLKETKNKINKTKNNWWALQTRYFLMPSTTFNWNEKIFTKLFSIHNWSNKELRVWDDNHFVLLYDYFNNAGWENFAISTPNFVIMKTLNNQTNRKIQN